jgi:uncharacterized membrane protein
MSGAKVLERLEAFRHTGTIIQTSLSPEMDDKLRDFIERQDQMTASPDNLRTAQP